LNEITYKKGANLLACPFFQCFNLLVYDKSLLISLISQNSQQYIDGKIYLSRAYNNEYHFMLSLINLEIFQLYFKNCISLEFIDQSCESIILDQEVIDEFSTPEVANYFNRYLNSTGSTGSIPSITSMPPKKQKLSMREKLSRLLLKSIFSSYCNCELRGGKKRKTRKNRKIRKTRKNKKKVNSTRKNNKINSLRQ
jgi:hypothetical protein